MLDSLLRPTSVAVVGASRTPGKVGHAVVANLVKSGFAGQIYPVNPKSEEILGLRCAPSLAEVRQPIDLCVIAVPPPAVKAAVEEALTAHVRAVAVLTAGFKEIGEEGAALEAEIARLCQKRKVPMMGPNCLGLINAHHQMNATFAPVMPPAGNISVISQSGALCVAILDSSASAGLGLAITVSLGNKADLDEVDFLQALAADPNTQVIVGYLESIDNGEDFLKAAQEAATEKPVVVLKVGVTASGAKAASSHTGSLAGADIAYGAAFKRSGVVRAETFEALFDYAQAFAMQPIPAGPRVTVITNAGGPGIMAADAAEMAGLRLPIPDAPTAAKLRSGLPDTASVGNPVDVIGDADPARYLRAFEIIQGSDGTDAIVVIATPQNMTQPTELAKLLAAAHDSSKPLLAAFLGGDEVREARRTLTALGIPNYPSAERAMEALKAMTDYSAWRSRPPRIVTHYPVNRRRIDRVLRWHRKMDLQQVGEVEAKEILRAYDFRIPEGQLVETADQAVEAAERVGYPVVMKIVSPDIIHKSDSGGVRLNLASADQVRDAYDLLMLRATRRSPDARLRGALVEKMGRRGREVILGMTRDPQFGPMLMFGLGGIFVEVMKDVTFHLAPITAEEAMQMLQGTRSYALLQGARGHRPVDLDAIAAGLQRISQLSTDYPEILELDINPYIVSEVGGGAYVADARMTIAVTDNER
jgi:acetyl coenzyme A synthetase (ADP forming)-like protein